MHRSCIEDAFSLSSTRWFTASYSPPYIKIKIKIIIKINIIEDDEYRYR